MHLFAQTMLFSVLSTVPPMPADEAPVVVELFTSQSCSSCPPAEAYLVELAKDKNIIALEWHVDYWDDLVYGRAGKWKDPFSSADYTKRQRRYNVALRGRNAAYTPQTVINGRYEMVGSRRAEIDAHIKMSNGVERLDAIHDQDKVAFSYASKTKPQSSTINALFVTFQKNGETDVKRGENHGKTLREAHIVKDFRILTENTEGRFIVDAPVDGEGCALLLQDKETMRIEAGAYCPASN